jgi:glutathione S-transferase
MITLHGFGPMFGLADPSPFVMKVMALLEIAGLPYEFKSADPRKGPKGKIPWLVDGDNVVADSTFIQWYLEETYDIDFYPGLDARDKAVGWAVEKMCEDHLYFCGVHERWVKEENFNKGPRKFFEIVPAVVRPLVVWQVKRQVVGKVRAQGLGMHGDDEIIQLAKRDIEALATLLGDNRYFFGERATATDAVVHSFVAGALTPFFEGPFRDAVRSHENPVAYEARLTGEWYGDTARGTD